MSEKHFIDTVDRVMYYAKQQGGKDIVLWYQQVKHSLPKLNKTQQQANIPLEILHQTDKEDVQKTL
jgi:cellobiose-specific phosphotransferase system component IIB